MNIEPHLKAFVRYDGSGRPVPGSLILRVKKPKIGKWKQVYKTNTIPTTTTTTSSSSTTSTSTSSTSTTTSSTSTSTTTTTTTTLP